MDGLPRFSIDCYTDLLAALEQRDYASFVVSELPKPCTGRRVYLRHDVDFLPAAAIRMAEKEADHGWRATYYFLLSGPYNLLSGENRRVLARLTALGHEVGLHYDLAVYPDDPRKAITALRDEVELLGQLCGQEIRTIAMHNPSLRGEDWFRPSDQFVHPHDPRWQDGLLYVSDSCRAWRDENLLRCFSPTPPRCLMLLTHPELWLDREIDNRREYLERVLEPLCVEPMRRYLLTDVAAIWQDHAGARAHDVREGGRRNRDEARFSWPTRGNIESQVEAIESRFREFAAMPWTREQILMDLPGKWRHSLLMHKEATVAGFSFNSVKGESLYMHALFVAPEFRRQGFGSRMIEMIRRRARLFRFRRVGLRVARSNRSAVRFYTRHGFAVTNNAEGTTDVEMEKLVA